MPSGNTAVHTQKATLIKVSFTLAWLLRALSRNSRNAAYWLECSSFQLAYWPVSIGTSASPTFCIFGICAVRKPDAITTRRTLDRLTGVDCG